MGPLHPTTAWLRWDNNASNDWELEFQPETVPFTGVPNFSGSGDSLLIPNLTPLTTYHWQIRQVCADTANGPWKTAPVFRTPPECTMGPAIGCGQPVTLSNEPGFNYLQACYGQFAGFGTEQYFSFTPAYSGEYTVKVAPVGGVNVGYALKQAGLSCVDSNWVCIGSSNVHFDQFLPTGLLLAGKTYVLAADFPDYDLYPDLNNVFQILCPAPCVAPDSLYATNLSGAQATLGWRPKPNQTQWEIELAPDIASFTGIPNYNSVISSLTIPLTQGLAYRWRVRGNCDSLGQSPWSPVHTFAMPPDCDGSPALSCDEERVVHFVAGNGYLNNSIKACGGPVFGQEQVFQFTVDSSATTRYVILPEDHQGNQILSLYYKETSSPCSSTQDQWICIGTNDVSTVFVLDQLSPGKHYYFLLKKALNTGVDSLRFRFTCALPCDPPTDAHTVVKGFDEIYLHWAGGNGPWQYAVEIRPAAGGAAQIKNFPWKAAGHNLFDWFTPAADALYEWRVRRVCNNGDTTAWTDWLRIKTPFECATAAT